MTVPNGISLGRIALVPVFVLLMQAGFEHHDLVAAAVFFALASTDSLDGWLARRYDAVTTFGTFLDPLADKVLVSCALVGLVGLGRLAPWVAMVIIAREFAVTALRLAAANVEVIGASWLGKAKTFSQIVAITALLLDTGQHAVEDVLVGVAVVLTVLSAADYFRRSLGHLQMGRTR